jgi:diguanylate cyclase (GGDEF)-like protein
MGGRTAWALDPEKVVTQYLHEEWRTRDGLPRNTVEAITQTPDGYLWIGTEGGLARFDGARVRTFSTSNTPALENNTIYALCVDRRGRLWVGTGGGLVRAEGETLVVPRDTPAPREAIFDLLEDRAGTLWAASTAGLIRLQDGARRIYTKKDGLPSNRLEGLWEDAAGNLWIGSAQGLVRRSPDGRFTTYTTADGLPGNDVRVVRGTRRGELWIGTNGNGLCCLRDGRFTTFGAGRGLPNTFIRSLAEDGQGNLWAGTNGGGLCRLEGDRFVTVTVADGLPSDHVLALFEDREANLWVGTSAGLQRLSDVPCSAFSTPEGFPAGSAWCVAPDHRGDLWFGTNGRGAVRRRGSQFTMFTTADGLASDTVLSVLEDRHGDLWFGTSAGLCRRSGDRYTTFDRRHGLASDVVLTVYEDTTGTLWAGTNGGGLYRFRGDASFTAFTTKDGLSNDIVRALCDDGRGNLWIGTNGGGLNILRDGRITAYTTGNSNLPSDLILSLLRDGEGVLWVGTHGGLSLLPEPGEPFQTLTSVDGLPDDVIFQILEDGETLWLGCNKGIVRVTKEELRGRAIGARVVQPLVLGTLDGMRTDECTGGVQPAGCRAADGALWFPTGQGVVRVDPKAVGHEPHVPAALVESMRVDGRAVDPRRPLRLRPGRGELEFHYTAPGFTAPKRLRFYYKLEGFDREWVEAGRRREAFYTNIPPGHYKFHVLARAEQGPWGKAASTAGFDLEPHFVQTPAFVVLCVLGAIAIVAAAYGFRTRHLRARQGELTRLVELRTVELREAQAALQQQNVKLAELARTDGLTGLKNRRHLLEEAEAHLAFAARQGLPLSFVMLDVDHFKAYNDAFGHPAGDEVLRRVAQVLRTALRECDVVARYGGEEFIILLPATDAATGVEVAERLRAAIAGGPWPHRGVTASFGLACSGEGPDTVAELVAAADRALYCAKRQGRNRVSHEEWVEALPTAASKTL